MAPGFILLMVSGVSLWPEGPAHKPIILWDKIGYAEISGFGITRSVLTPDTKQAGGVKLEMALKYLIPLR